MFQDLVKKALGLSIFETAENNEANIGGMKMRFKIAVIGAVE